MASSGPIVPQNYASLYLRIHSKDFFFQTLQMKFPNKSFVGPNGQFWPSWGPKLHKLIFRDPVQKIFSKSPDGQF